MEVQSVGDDVSEVDSFLRDYTTPTYRWQCPQYVKVLAAVAAGLVALWLWRYPATGRSDGTEYGGQDVELPDYPDAHNPQTIHAVRFTTPFPRPGPSLQLQRFVAAAPMRAQAFEELHQGQKRGHWIWWVFPTLQDWGGDLNSAYQQADLDSCAEAEEFLHVPDLRAAYLKAIALAYASMDRYPQQAPFHLFDEALGRQPQGKGSDGPIDSFKVRASATLFASAASKLHDREVVQACVQMLQHFNGDCTYQADGPGTAGYVPGAEGQALVLQGPDLEVLRLCGVSWEWLLAS